MSAPRLHAQSPFRTRPRAAGTPAYQIRASGDETEILLYEEIGFFGVNAKDFVRDLQQITTPTIHLRINSPGGDVFDGTAIANALDAHPARIVTHIDSLAASISSVIALAGDEIVMAKNAFLMIHEPFALTVGTAADLRHTADTLDKVAGNIENTYVERSGASVDQVREWMADETWFTAEEAVDAGFADSVAESTKIAARFDLSIYAHAPTALQPSTEPPHTRRTDRLAAGQQPTIRFIEDALRDVGLSKQDAKAIAACGFPALSRRDAADLTDPDTRAALDRLFAALQCA